MFDPRHATAVVVEDDAGLRESLAFLIASVEYRYIGYASAEEYLQNTQPEAPCCLLLDLQLPGMSGIELQRQIRNSRPHLPIVFISGNAGRSEIEQALAGGAFEFLLKPFDPETILSRIESGMNESLTRGK